jgi:alpha-D-ribose 1-methylphosphonate 5-phosphate C-P lyase
MSVRNIKVTVRLDDTVVKVRMRTPSKPFKAGDILCLHMPDRKTVKFLAGPTKNPLSCSDCAIHTWNQCVRTRLGMCIRRYTANNNAILEPGDLLEEL